MLLVIFYIFLVYHTIYYTNSYAGFWFFRIQWMLLIFPPGRCRVPRKLPRQQTSSRSGSGVAAALAVWHGGL